MTTAHTIRSKSAIALAALIGSALLSPAASAAPACAHTAPQALTLDLAGARGVIFEVGAQDLQLVSRNAGDGRLSGRACASSKDLLSTLSITQRREGDQQVVRMERSQGVLNLNLGNSYAWLELRGALPARLPVTVRVRSGDATVSGAPSLHASVGSGDLEASDIAGSVTLSVGSGEAQLQRIGSLQLEAVGSGDVNAQAIAGAARIGSLGSGDISLKQVKGNVDIGNVGSGDIALDGVGGNVSLRAMGSGALEVRDVAGNLSATTVRSGQVRHQRVHGQVQLPPER